MDACWAVSYLSDGSNDNIQAVIESGICPRLVDLLRHPSTSVQTPALRSIGNITTGDNLQAQMMIMSGALPALHSLLSSPKAGIRREACWTISNITAGPPPQIQAVIDAHIIPPLIDILSNSDSDFKTRKEHQQNRPRAVGHLGCCDDRPAPSITDTPPLATARSQQHSKYPQHHRSSPE